MLNEKAINAINDALRHNLRLEIWRERNGKIRIKVVKRKDLVIEPQQNIDT